MALGQCVTWRSYGVACSGVIVRVQRSALVIRRTSGALAGKLTVRLASSVTPV